VPRRRRPSFFFFLHLGNRTPLSFVSVSLPEVLCFWRGIPLYSFTPYNHRELSPSLRRSCIGFLHGLPSSNRLKPFPDRVSLRTGSCPLLPLPPFGLISDLFALRFSFLPSAKGFKVDLPGFPPFFSAEDGFLSAFLSLFSLYLSTEYLFPYGGDPLQS